MRYQRVSGVLPHISQILISYIVSATLADSEGVTGQSAELFSPFIRYNAQRSSALHCGGQYRPFGQSRPVAVAASCSCGQLQLRPVAVAAGGGYQTPVRNTRSTASNREDYRPTNGEIYYCLGPRQDFCRYLSRPVRADMASIGRLSQIILLDKQWWPISAASLGAGSHEHGPRAWGPIAAPLIGSRELLSRPTSIGARQGQHAHGPKEGGRGSLLPRSVLPRRANTSSGTFWKTIV